MCVDHTPAHRAVLPQALEEREKGDGKPPASGGGASSATAKKGDPKVQDTGLKLLSWLGMFVAPASCDLQPTLG